MQGKNTFNIYRRIKDRYALTSCKNLLYFIFPITLSSKKFNPKCIPFKNLDVII